MNTDINLLQGRELDEAVAIAAGWTTYRQKFIDGQITQTVTMWLSPGSSTGLSFPGNFSRSVSDAMGLLLGMDSEIQIQMLASGYVLVSQWIGRTDQKGRWEELASGPKSEAASVICRAFLKIKGRG